jgi:hypothetical protein
MSDFPIIFSHYGNIDYLAKSLLCASITNPAKRKILIGDRSNKYTAIANGWEHVAMDEIGSSLLEEFNRSFVYVRGKYHVINKNDGDWLRFVFKRWYIIQKFCEDNQIERFWHFDSDVMILEDLRLFEPSLVSNFSYTTQCNAMCLNGMVGLKTLTEFCEFTISLFENKEFIAAQQHEFDTVNPGYAFTEMRAFEKYAASSSCSGKGVHLAAAFKGWWFDDCICQDHDFVMENCALAQRPIKQIAFHDGAFWGRRFGEELRFAILNLSWVPTALFDWVISAILRKQHGKDDKFPTIAYWAGE